MPSSMQANLPLCPIAATTDDQVLWTRRPTKDLVVSGTLCSLAVFIRFTPELARCRQQSARIIKLEFYRGRVHRDMLLCSEF